MSDALPAVIVFGYLAVALGIGLLAGGRGRGGVDDFVAGDRAFGPVVMYFVMGATIFSAYALLGTPQRVVEKGSDALYIIAYGAAGFVPVFYFGGRVRRLGARHGFVTQAELLGGRFQSRFVTATMGGATVLAFLPYMMIQLKGAGMVMHAVTGWPPVAGAAVVYGVVTVYVVVGGVRGVGWTNVLQGIAMLVVVWGLGLWIPARLFGGIGPMFDRLVAEAPEFLVLPGPGDVGEGEYSSEILVSMLGFTMWPQVFMKCFTARSARLVQLSAVLYASFLFFLVPLLFLGWAAVLMGGPADDTVLLWIVQHPALGDTTLVFAFVAFAVLAASMSTGDALLHAGGSIAVRDVLVGGLGIRLDDRAQTRAMRAVIVALAAGALLLLHLSASISVVDLLLLAYAVPIQFLPPTILGLYWRRANRVGACWGLGVGLFAVVALLLLSRLAPGVYSAVNPAGLQIGVLAGASNLMTLVLLSLIFPPLPDEHLRRYEL